MRTVVIGLGCNVLALALARVLPPHSKWVALFLSIFGFILIGIGLVKHPLEFLKRIFRLNNTLVPLEEAARTVYGVMRVSKHPESHFTEYMASDQEILLSISYSLMSEIPIYGRRSPSNQIEQIDREICQAYAHRVSFREGITSFESYLANNSGNFTDISVRK